jgi:hypothetical protein
VDFLGIADRIWPLTRRAMRLHTVAYRATGGRIGHRFPGSPPMLLLDHVGAKTGASKGGYPKNPGWFYNLRANPDTTIQVGSERRTVRARVAGIQERARLWPKVLETYSGYGDYQRRTDRQIPLVILETRPA